MCNSSYIFWCHKYCLVLIWLHKNINREWSIMKMCTAGQACFWGRAGPPYSWANAKQSEIIVIIMMMIIMKNQRGKVNGVFELLHPSLPWRILWSFLHAFGICRDVWKSSVHSNPYGALSTNTGKGDYELTVSCWPSSSSSSSCSSSSSSSSLFVVSGQYQLSRGTLMSWHTKTKLHSSHRLNLWLDKLS